MRRIAVLDAPSNLGLRPPTATSVPGCAKAPGALRDQGLLTKLGARDAGCLTPPRYDPGDWRPGDGVAHAAEIAAYSRALADRIGAIIDGGEFPVVLGGDCSILIGAGIAMHRLGDAVGGRIGLVFVDGHSDFRHPGNASYVGAAAGEDLALVTGRGQANLAAIESRRPYFRDIDVVVLGIRAQDEYRLDLQAAGIVTRPVPALRAEGAARSAQWARDQLVDCAGYWVHIDVDVLDPAVMPAVDAPDPGGIAFPELELLLSGLVESPHCLGVEITVFDPDYDPDGRYAAEITSAVVGGLSPVRSTAPRPDLIAARRDLDRPAGRRVASRPVPSGRGAGPASGAPGGTGAARPGPGAGSSTAGPEVGAGSPAAGPGSSLAAAGPGAAPASDAEREVVESPVTRISIEIQDPGSGPTPVSAVPVSALPDSAVPVPSTPGYAASDSAADREPLAERFPPASDSGPAMPAPIVVADGPVVVDGPVVADGAVGKGEPSAGESAEGEPAEGDYGAKDDDAGPVATSDQAGADDRAAGVAASADPRGGTDGSGADPADVPRPSTVTEGTRPARVGLPGFARSDADFMLAVALATGHAPVPSPATLPGQQARPADDSDAPGGGQEDSGAGKPDRGGDNPGPGGGQEDSGTGKPDPDGGKPGPDGGQEDSGTGKPSPSGAEVDSGGGEVAVTVPRQATGNPAESVGGHRTTGAGAAASPINDAPVAPAVDLSRLVALGLSGPADTDTPVATMSGTSDGAGPGAVGGPQTVGAAGDGLPDVAGPDAAGSDEVVPSELGPNKVGPNKVGSYEVGSNEVDAAVPGDQDGAVPRSEAAVVPDHAAGGADSGSAADDPEPLAETVETVTEPGPEETAAEHRSEPARATPERVEPERAEPERVEVRLLSRPLGSAPLLDSEPLPATRPGMLRPRPPADAGFGPSAAGPGSFPGLPPGAA